MALSDALVGNDPSLAAPHYSRGQIIAGILADALAGAAGHAGPMAARWNDERQQQQEIAKWNLQRRGEMQDWQTKQDYTAAHETSPMERDVGAWQHMTPEQRSAYQDMEKAREGDPIVTITLPNGQMYSGPRSGLAQAMMGGGQAPQRPPIGTVVPDPRQGGPTQPASGGFLRR